MYSIKSGFIRRTSLSGLWYISWVTALHLDFEYIGQFKHPGFSDIFKKGDRDPERLVAQCLDRAGGNASIFLLGRNATAELLAWRRESFCFSQGAGSSPCRSCTSPRDRAGTQLVRQPGKPLLFFFF